MKPLALLVPFIAIFASAQDIPSLVNVALPQLVSTYKELHQHPELSHQEQHTSAFLADGLRKAGYEVTENVGQDTDGKRAYGVVAVMKNGSGPTVLVRTDMDALPVEEQTGLPYASHVRAKNDADRDDRRIQRRNLPADDGLDRHDELGGHDDRVLAHFGAGTVGA